MEIVRRKSVSAKDDSKKNLVDILRTSVIIADTVLNEKGSLSGSLTIEFHNGGITSSKLELKNIL